MLQPQAMSNRDLPSREDPGSERPARVSPARMRPLAQVPPETLRRLTGVLTDIDDTLTAEGAIEPAALRALEQLAAAQIPVIAITGRPAGWSEPFALAWPVRAIVAENGGVMLRREADAGTHAGERSGVMRLMREFTQDTATRAANHARLQACAQDVLRNVPAARLAQDSAGRLTDIAVDHSEFSLLDDAQINEVVALMQAHGLHATVSSIHINGWIGEHTKWTAAQWAVERCLGQAFEPNDWAYVGDSTNDQLMFERVPLSVGVANIARFVPVLKVLPAYVTRAERGAGFAEFAEALLTARGGSVAPDRIVQS